MKTKKLNLINRLIVNPYIQNKTLPEQVSQLLGLKLEYKTKEELINEFKNIPIENIFTLSKKTIFFTENKGRFLKKCPGSDGVICCNYYTINSVTGCIFDCSYCILQHYIFNNPFITVFVNREKIKKEISDFLFSHKKIRVGTGELADSLALDHITGESEFFLKLIKENSWEKNITFEFKTKSDNVDILIENVKKYENCDIVVGFSVNIDLFSQKEEKYTSSIDDRLNAASFLIENGIDISIHFDPIIMLPQFLKNYKELIKKIFSKLNCEKIRWISMGGARHTLALTSIIRKRFPDSYLLLGEMFPSDKDNKLRYISSLRRIFYKELKREIEKYYFEPPLYLCMEKDFMWKYLSLQVNNKVLRDIF